MRDDTAEQLEFTVTGMDCGACADKVTRAVARLPGVRRAEVALISERLRLERAPDGATGEEVAAAVRAIGFGVAPAPRARAGHHAAHDHGACHDHHAEHDHDAGHDHGAGHEHGDCHDHDHDHAGAARGAHGHGAAAANPAAMGERTAPRAVAPTTSRWYRTAKGRFLIATGGLLAAAWLAKLLAPGAVAYWAFVLACCLGTLPVARRALALARAGVPFTIEALMTVAAAGALVIGAAEEAAMVVFLFAVGEMLESLAAARARGGIRALAALLPDTALVVHGDHTHAVPADSLRPGQIVRLRPGDRAPCDGRVVAGTAGLDESAVTGESLPVARGPGDAVVAGAICTDAAIDVEVTAAAGAHTVARIARMVEAAEAARAPTQRFIEAFARVYMPIIVGLSALVAVVPPLAFGGDWGDWTYRALTLLLVGCPCALVISVPAAVATGLAAGARSGVLFKGGAALEATARLSHVALDKTGTLTEGRFAVVGLHLAPGVTEDAALGLAAAVEAGSSHPLARAILAEAARRGLPVPAATRGRILPGVGAEAEVEGGTVQAVSLRHAGPESLPAALRTAAVAAEADGASVVVLRRDGTPRAVIALKDVPRPEAAAAVAALRALGVAPVMLTGDNAGAARAVAAQLGLDAEANLTPADKLAALERLAARGGVMMVGDGVNDAPALKRATIGVAMGAGTDVALEAADAALMRDDLRGVPAMIDLARRTRANILQNVAVALGLKAAFIVLSVTGGATLWMAVLADTGATLLVTLNALRLRRWRAPA